LRAPEIVQVKNATRSPTPFACLTAVHANPLYNRKTELMINMTDIPPIARLNEVADFLRVSIRTFQRWEIDGILPSMNYPGRRKRLKLIPAADPARRQIFGAARPA
jgi:hypothetical protein